MSIPDDLIDDEVTSEEFKDAVRVNDYPTLNAALDAAKAKYLARRGRGPQKAPTKQIISIRLDADVLRKFRATGKGWQSRINAVLTAHAPRARRRVSRAARRKSTRAGR